MFSLNPLTKNGFTVKVSFQFAEEIHEQDPTLSMGTLGNIYGYVENTDTAAGVTKSHLKKLLCLVTKESHFAFTGLIYKQIDGVAMDSTLKPSLAKEILS